MKRYEPMSWREMEEVEDGEFIRYESMLNVLRMATRRNDEKVDSLERQLKVAQDGREMIEEMYWKKSNRVNRQNVMLGISFVVIFILAIL